MGQVTPLQGLGGGKTGKARARQAFLTGQPRTDMLRLRTASQSPQSPYIPSRKGARLGAALAADAVVAQEDALRVQPPLDLQQPRVLLAPLVLRAKLSCEGRAGASDRVARTCCQSGSEKAHSLR